MRRNNGHNFFVLLCMFHVLRAMLTKFRESGIRDKTTIFLLFISIKVIRQSRTWGIANARFGIFVNVILPLLLNDAVLVADLATYFSENWMCDEWRSCWIDAGRFEACLLVIFVLRIY